MPLTMRPTGGHSPVYAGRQDWTIFDAGKPVGRIYEDATAGTPAELRWFWSVICVRGPAGGRQDERGRWRRSMRPRRSLRRRGDAGSTGRKLASGKRFLFVPD